MTAEQTIGVAGLGGIGGAMARRLHDTGHPVVGVDPDDRRRDQWIADTGRSSAPGVSGLEWAGVSHLVVAVKTEDQAIDVISTASERAAPTLAVIIVTTVPVGFWRRIGEIVSPAWRVFEAPVSGGEQQAASGDVAMFLCGRGLPEDHRILDDLSNRVVEFAVHGQPAFAKLLNNTVAATNALNVTLALSLAREQGISPDLFLSALNEGSGRSLMSQSLALLSPHQYELLEKDVGLLRAENVDLALGADVRDLASAVRDALGAAYDPTSVL